jgi:hypothetical protein
MEQACRCQQWQLGILVFEQSALKKVHLPMPFTDMNFPQAVYTRADDRPRFMFDLTPCSICHFQNEERLQLLIFRAVSRLADDPQRRCGR